MTTLAAYMSEIGVGRYQFATSSGSLWERPLMNGHSSQSVISRQPDGTDEGRFFGLPSAYKTVGCAGSRRSFNDEATRRTTRTSGLRRTKPTGNQHVIPHECRKFLP